MGELARPREIERHGLVPLRLGRVFAEMTTAAGVVDQNVDRAQAGQRLAGGIFSGVLGENVLDDDDGFLAAGRDDLGSDLLEKVAPASGDGEAYAFGGQGLGDAASDPHAGARHERRLTFEMQFHRGGSNCFACFRGNLTDLTVDANEDRRRCPAVAGISASWPAFRS